LATWQYYLVGWINLHNHLALYLQQIEQEELLDLL
jgi:hypothetical protein